MYHLSLTILLYFYYTETRQELSLRSMREKIERERKGQELMLRDLKAEVRAELCCVV